MHVIGTRPNFIKIAPIYNEFRKHSRIEQILVHTGQHYDRNMSKIFFKELKALVDSVHKRGLAHCDLKRAPNIILGPNGKPYIVDWSASIFKSEFSLLPLNLIYERFIKDDHNAIIKIQLRHCPEGVSPKDKMKYAHRSRIEKSIRLVRDKARKLLQRIA